MQEIQEKGYQPDGIVLLLDEAETMLEENFNWHKGDPLPQNIKLFGLPVRVQE